MSIFPGSGPSSARAGSVIRHDDDRLSEGEVHRRRGIPLLQGFDGSAAGGDAEGTCFPENWVCGDGEQRGLLVETVGTGSGDMGMS